MLKTFLLLKLKYYHELILQLKCRKPFCGQELLHQLVHRGARPTHRSCHRKTIYYNFIIIYDLQLNSSSPGNLRIWSFLKFWNLLRNSYKKNAVFTFQYNVFEPLYSAVMWTRIQRYKMKKKSEFNQPNDMFFFRVIV